MSISKQQIKNLGWREIHITHHPFYMMEVPNFFVATNGEKLIRSERGWYRAEGIYILDIRWIGAINGSRVRIYKGLGHSKGKVRTMTKFDGMVDNYGHLKALMEMLRINPTSVPPIAQLDATL